MTFRYPDSAIRNALISDANVTRHIGHRVFSQYASPDDDVPFVVVRRSGIDREQTLSAPMGLPKLSLDLDIYALTYESARNIADAIRGVLDGFSGSFDNTHIDHVSLEDESDELVQLAGSEKPPAFSVRMSFDIWWQEI